MTRARRISGVLAAVYAGLVLANLVGAVAGLSNPARGVLSIALGLIGLAVGWSSRHELEPWSAKEARDAAAGWGFVIAVTLIALALLIPSPWGAVVAVALGVGVVAVVLTVRRRIASPSVGSASG